MNEVLRLRDSFGDDIFTKICDAINKQGYIILDDVFSDNLLNDLLANLIKSRPHEFNSAGIGRENKFHKNPFVRQDKILWLDQSEYFLNDYLRWIDELRKRINRQLFLGLFDYECMFAHYEEGAFYKKHIDSFKGSNNRRLSSILYLNTDWKNKDGGELLIYKDNEKEAFEKVQPQFGRMVLFLSEVFPHEVLAAQRSRFSLTGWFRINNS